MENQKSYKYSIPVILEKIKSNKHKQKFIDIFVIIVLSISFYSRNYIIGTGGYNKNIKLTDDMIVYTRAKPGQFSLMGFDLFLVDIKTKDLFQLTNDSYGYTGVSWSPDGTRLLIGAHRSQKKIARYSDSHNPSYLFIYDFRTGNESSLEKSFFDSEEELKKQFENEGYKIKEFSDPLPNSIYPHWFKMNRIGFHRNNSKYLEMSGLRSTDTLGNNMTVYRKPEDELNWVIGSPKWISEDSLIVTIKNSSFDLKSPKNIALYLPYENRFIPLTDMKENNYALLMDLLIDKNQILYNEILKPEDQGGKRIRKSVIMDINSQKKHSLPKNILASIFSPSGKRVAYIKENTKRESEIFIADIDGKNIKQITFDGGHKGILAWRPTSTY